MADAMDMSLDDIIKSKRTSRGRGRGRGRGAASGGQQRQQRGGQRSPFKPQQGGFRRGGGRPGGRSAAATASSAQGPSSGHIVISNLHFQVSDADITELFGELGPIKKAAVHYDSSGKSQGSADVVYSRYQDAVKAMQKYNGVPLDGREMKIMIASAQFAQAVSPQRKSFGGSPRGGRGGRSGFAGRGGSGGAGGRGATGGGRGRGGRGRGRGRGGSSAKPMTKEQLDAEIDAYHTESQPMES